MKKELEMRNVVYLLNVVIISILITGLSYAANNGSPLSQENTELKQRVEKLDKEVEELKQIVANQTGTSAAPSEKKWVWSKLDIQLYGYLKLDAAYDSSRTEVGDYAKWVNPENMNHNDNQFNITANETRLGMLINGPDDGNLITSGRVEVDFYGGGDENKSHLMMRHAYLKMDWPKQRFNIIAGQTSDVISPLVPSTLNYSVLWWVGNIGYRRPQIRLTKEYTVKKNVDFKLEGAVARTIGRMDAVAAPNGTESGEDAGFPSLQGRASVTLPLVGEKKTTVGVSGHWGKEEYDITATGMNKTFKTWSLNLDLTQPVNDKCTIKAEVFTGRNLNAYLGGIGQGVITDTTQLNFYKEITSKGGWIAASLGPWDNFRYNVGVGMDDVDSGQINAGDRTMNRCVFGNVIYAANKQTDIGFELSHWRTEYYGNGDAESLRAQLSFIYKF